MQICSNYACGKAASPSTVATIVFPTATSSGNALLAIGIGYVNSPLLIADYIGAIQPPAGVPSLNSWQPLVATPLVIQSFGTIMAWHAESIIGGDQHHVTMTGTGATGAVFELTSNPSPAVMSKILESLSAIQLQNGDQSRAMAFLNKLCSEGFSR